MDPTFVIADTYYPGFLTDYYARDPSIDRQGYRDQHAHLMAQHFGTADAYAAGLRRLGCRAETVVLNANPLQRQWAREHDVPADASAKKWHSNTFVEQIRSLRPDVLLVQEISVADDDLLARIRPYVRFMIGQIACSLPGHRRFAHYDLVVSSWPPIVAHFRRRGMNSEYLPLGFDADVPGHLDNHPPMRGVTFVGGLSNVHRDRIRLLEHLCRHLPIDVYGYGLDSLPADSIIRRHHRGPAWGIDAYRALHRSALTINVHGDIDVDGPCDTRWANNLRLFEATGVGTMLLTDWKENLQELFDIGSEIVAYRNPDECLEFARHYLDAHNERRAIADAGQRRTLSSHTYDRRMADLLDIICRHWSRLFTPEPRPPRHRDVIPLSNLQSKTR